MEEHTGKQVNVERSQELIRTGANRITTACPFCYIMIDDGIKGEGLDDDQLRVTDIATTLLEAIQNGERDATPATLSASRAGDTTTPPTTHSRD